MFHSGFISNLSHLSPQPINLWYLISRLLPTSSSHLFLGFQVGNSFYSRLSNLDLIFRLLFLRTLITQGNQNSSFIWYLLFWSTCFIFIQLDPPRSYALYKARWRNFSAYFFMAIIDPLYFGGRRCNWIFYKYWTYSFLE